jgi:hypothetical protein
MSHPHLDDVWMDLIEGRLEGADAERVRAHVGACAECEAHLRRLSAAHRVALAATGRARGGDVEGQEERSGAPAPSGPATPRDRAALAEAGLLDAMPADEQVPPHVEGQILQEVVAIASGALRPTSFRKPTADEAEALGGKEPPEEPDVEGMAGGTAVPCSWCGVDVEPPRTFGWRRCPVCHAPLVAR